MLTRDDWRSLTAIFAAFQEAVLYNDHDYADVGDELHQKLATWLRDHDMPLLEIDREAWKAIPSLQQFDTPGTMLAGNLVTSERNCWFEFDMETGDLVEGCLTWRLHQAAGRNGNYRAVAVQAGEYCSLRLLARRLGGGQYQVSVCRLSAERPPRTRLPRAAATSDNVASWDEY